MAQNGSGNKNKKKKSANIPKDVSSVHKKAAESRQKSAREANAQDKSNKNNVNLQSAIASKIKTLSDAFKNLHNKLNSSAKNTNQKKSETISTPGNPQSAQKQKIKIGETINTSITESLPQSQSAQFTKPNKPQNSRSASKSGELTFSEFISEYSKKLWVRILIIIFIVFLATYVVYQIYLNYYTDVKTEIVGISTYSETIDTEGISIRDESAITEPLSASSVSAVENGAKVSKGQPIINIFDSPQAAAAYKRIDEIDSEISELQSMTIASEDSATEVSNIEKQLDEQFGKLARCVNSGELNQISDIKGTITYLMNKRLVAMRKVEDYQERINNLNNEKQTLESTYSKTPSAINSPSSGYYVNSIDGYENLLNTSMLSDLTPSKLNDIMNQEVVLPENSAGKLIKNFSWYLACPVSAQDAEDYLSVNSVYTLILPYSRTSSMQGTLTYLNKGDGDKYLAIFRCNSLISELCNIRRQPVKIQIRSYTGFNIKKSALHIRMTTVENKDDDGNVISTEEVRYPCVYTIVGNQVVAKRINILYNGEKNIICSSKESGGNYLALYDKVITEGKGLYAGKIIN